MTDIKKHLAQLIKQAGGKRDDTLSKAAGDVSAKLDQADNGTSAATTGERAAENRSDAAAYTAATVDGGAKTNPVNASVTSSTDGATAGTDQHGGKGADMEPVKDANTGKEKPENKIAAVRQLLEEVKAFSSELRKSAAALVIVEKGETDDETEEDKDKDKQEKDKQEKEASAAPAKPTKQLDKLGQFLVHIARNSSDQQLRKTAAEMEDPALADAATAEMMGGLEDGSIDEGTASQILSDAEEFGAVGEEDYAEAGDEAAAELIAAIEAGQVSEEEAAAILEELMAGGAVTEEDLLAAEDMGGEGMVDDGMSPVAEPTPEDMVAAGDLAGDDVAGALAEGGLDPKVAHLLAIRPGDPRYLEKLSSLYPDAEAAGAAAFAKLAGDLLKEGEADESPSQSEAIPEPQPETNVAAGADGQPGGPADVTALADSIKTEGPEAKLALAEVMEELGLTEQDVAALNQVKVAATNPHEQLKAQFRNNLLAKAAAARAAK